VSGDDAHATETAIAASVAIAIIARALREPRCRVSRSDDGLMIRTNARSDADRQGRTPYAFHEDPWASAIEGDPCRRAALIRPTGVSTRKKKSDSRTARV